MTEKKKNILLAVLIVGVVSMTVAYAALSSNLNINGSASVQNISESWNIHFAHISNTANEVKTSGYASADSSITVENTTVTVPEVTLKAPGDKVEYLFKVVNEGDITGYINVLNNVGFGTITYDKDETLTPEQKTAFQNDIQVTLTYSDGNALAYNDALDKGDETELLLTIQYINRATEQVMPSKNVTFTGISASITYGQDRTSLSGNGDAPAAPEIVQPSKKPTMAEMCPGCVFGKTNTKIGSELTSGYSDSYSELGNYFLGYKLNGNTVERAFACGIENGEAFCLEGTTDGSKYSKNVDILNAFFPGCNADSSGSRAECNGSSLYRARAIPLGHVYVNGTSSSYCGVNNYGDANCN